MTWEETILHIRQLPEFAALVEKAYFDENLVLNVERFMSSQEFLETLAILKKASPNAKSMLDIGSGNGISAVAFALKGFDVTAIEPDSSKTVGAGAIRILKDHYDLKNLQVYEFYAENMELPPESFDIVYARQAMHHAYDLQSFVSSCSRMLKREGIMFTVRDHVVFDALDKEKFLLAHDLQKFYGGENAFHPAQYQGAMQNAGLKIIQEFKFFDNIINYYPLNTGDIFRVKQLEIDQIKNNLTQKLGVLGKLPFIYWAYTKLRGLEPGSEKNIPGRMYSYLAKKTS